MLIGRYSTAAPRDVKPTPNRRQADAKKKKARCETAEKKSKCAQKIAQIVFDAKYQITRSYLTNYHLQKASFVTPISFFRFYHSLLRHSDILLPFVMDSVHCLRAPRRRPSCTTHPRSQDNVPVLTPAVTSNSTHRSSKLIQSAFF